MREEINESVDVIAVFYAEKKSIEVLRMRWGSRSYKARQTYTTWPVKFGQIHELHFSVELDSGDVVDLALQIDGTTLHWRLATITLAGAIPPAQPRKRPQKPT